MPSGILNVVLKKMVYTNSNLPSTAIIRLSLKSAVPRGRVLNYISLMDSIKEQMETTDIKFYRQEEKNKKKTVHVNMASNFLLRHYSDSLVISIYTDSRQTLPVFTTRLELNNIELNEETMTIMVVGTGAMNEKTNNIIYFLFELDLLFEMRLASDDLPSELTIALQNYKLMKQQVTNNNAVRVTEEEKQIIEMMLSRA
jgi:hypothetical protein